MFKSVKIKGCSASIPPDAPVKPHLAGEAIDGRGLSVITLFMSLPASLNVIARRSPLSVILRLDRIIHYFLSRFRILRSSRIMTGKKKVPEHDRNKKAIIAEKSRNMR